MIYNDLGALIGIIAIIIGILRLKNGKMSLGMALLWTIIWLVIIWISLFPESTNLLAGLTGIGRGLDAVLIFGLILSYYLIFKMYGMIENMDKEITLLVREIALQRGDLKEKIDNECSKDLDPSDEKSKTKSK
ncbi:MULTISPECIES: DUF2304 domain-containing protein [Methanobacterium]|uniref:DUF2304 domain-containing protein n=1 Tax=Methanobacterium bryantii TaxID=2161 RepID=A0A2A2H3L9_METBR|nr:MULTISPECIES: DUF2304 family protein [Methanobacterium]OEC86126.1 hypothetical protein A9507_11790 [Methanobacterium sp. A39]PAV03886.1 hypothetical protein ASJ80_02380 [Methanobacterium bryantii]